MKHFSRFVLAFCAVLLLYGSAFALAPCWPENGITGTNGSGALGLDFLYLPSDTPAVAYYEPVKKDLYYTTFDGADWQGTRVDKKGGMFPSLALDAASAPAISYYRGKKKDLRFAWYDTRKHKWRGKSIDKKGDVGSASSLAYLPSGAPAIAYYDASKGDLKYAYAYKGNKKWRKTRVDTIGDVGNNPSLAILDDNPVITYADADGGLKYAWFDGFVWQNTIIDADADPQARSSLKILNTGKPAVSYVDGNTGALKYACLDGGVWQSVTVDGDVNAGPDVSMTLLGNGHPAIGYRDETNGAVKYAWFDGADWQVATVDITGETGFAGMNRVRTKSDGTVDMVYADWPNYCARIQSLDALSEPTLKSIVGDVPEYEWRYGCAPTAGGMIVGFWDRTAYPNLVDGEMPTAARAGMDDLVDGVIAGDEHADDPFYWKFAGKKGVRWDGKRDRWVFGGPQPSRARDCIADYMNTTMPDGGSYGWDIAWGMRDYAVNHPNGTEPGYFAVDIYSDPTIDHLIHEIDAGRPVMLFVFSEYGAHAVTVFGYDIDDETGEYYYAVRDTWGDGLTDATEGAFRREEVVDEETMIVEWWKWQTFSDDGVPADEWQVYQLLSFTPVGSEDEAVVTLYEGLYEQSRGKSRGPLVGWNGEDGGPFNFSGGAANVPEPLSAVLTLVGLAGLYIHKKRRRGNL